MAEVRKKQTIKKYNVDKELEDVQKNNKTKKKNTEKKVTKTNQVKKESTKKKSLWTRFRIFCHGVKSEFQKVFWPTKKDMIKYSITTILFIIFLSVFFYLIDVVFALFLKLFG